jgi:hypothetical protein
MTARTSPPCRWRTQGVRSRSSGESLRTVFNNTSLTPWRRLPLGAK